MHTVGDTQSEQLRRALKSIAFNLEADVVLVYFDNNKIRHTDEPTENVHLILQLHSVLPTFIASFS